MNRLAMATVVCVAFAGSVSPQSIQYSGERKLWLLNTARTSYAMGLGALGQLQHLYWGAPLWRMQDLPAVPSASDISSFDPRQMLENEEFPGWGRPRYYEPALKVIREDGDRDLVLRYASHRIAGNELDIELKDLRDDIRVTLHYRVYPEYDVLRRSATIANRTASALTLESAQSATWDLPLGDGYQLRYLTGRWAAETQLNTEPIHPGLKVLESRKEHTSHNNNPWFSIDAGDATEDRRRIWFGALAWSGNWRISVEQTPYRQARVTGGFNTFDFSHVLRPGGYLHTPDFFGGFTGGGYGEASRILHRFERDQIVPGGAALNCSWWTMPGSASRITTKRVWATGS